MLWQYNCLDTVYTNEVWENLLTLVESQGMTEQVDFQHLVERTMLRIMFRGVRWDIRLAKEYSRQLARQMQDRLDFLERIFGYPVNPRSPQLRKLFYEVLRVQPVYKRKTERPTLDDAALQKVADREPLVRPIVKAVQEFRSLGTVKATMVDAEPDEDERMRTSYNTAGTETFRFSSSTTAFGRGMNLQNLPREEEEELYPNIRSLVQPDEGFLLMEWDLSQADLCVVAWEADDRALKQMLREGVDVHAENAHELGMSRYDGKRWTHATDYGLMPYMAARKFGITVHQAELRQRRYFEMYPGILLWHKRVWNALEVHHAVWNVFGYRRFYFGRIEPSLLPHALAWVPQSTVAIVINKALVAVDQKLPSVEILLQTHDSFTAQVLARLAKRTIPKISELAHIVLPYPDPLTIPIKCKVSKVSWGEVKEI
jgi:DNA polymerase I-like protein with 3'-5' exonuclease and polymerase domains